nr:MAG TPA: hypothetical protein [Caudoviricetes sp.]
MSSRSSSPGWRALSCVQGCDRSVTTKSHRQYRARMKPSTAGECIWH